MRGEWRHDRPPGQRPSPPAGWSGVNGSRPEAGGTSRTFDACRAVSGTHKATVALRPPWHWPCFTGGWRYPLVPRTESPKKRSVRFCGDCGYELARDNDGTCPMCRRFEQLRLDFIVSRPSDVVTQRLNPGLPDASSIPDEWPPTPAEYRAILAERALRSGSAKHAATVLRKPALRQSKVPPPPAGASAPGDGALRPPADPKPSVKDLLSPTPTKANTKGRRGPSKSGRAARGGVRSARVPETTTRPAAAVSSAPVESSGEPLAAPSSSTLPRAVGVLSTTAASPKSKRDALPRQNARPLLQPKPARHGAPSPTVVPVHSLVIVAIGLVASALFGAAVSILLSLL